MSNPSFVERMEQTLWQILGARDAELSRMESTARRDLIPRLLRGALHNEREATEIALLWIESTPETEVKSALARQAEDETRHYQLITRRLAELGETVAGSEPTDRHSRLFQYLESLPTTVERVAGALFTREAIGFKANELFIVFCEQAGDRETAELYRAKIQPDEKHHHDWGRDFLSRTPLSQDDERRVSQAILRTLELAEELRSLAAGKLLVEALPGC